MSLGLIYSTVMLKLYVTPYLIQHVCYSSVKKKSNCGPKAILMVTIQPTISVGVAVMCVSSIGDRSGSYEKLYVLSIGTRLTKTMYLNSFFMIITACFFHLVNSDSVIHRSSGIIFLERSYRFARGRPTFFPLYPWVAVLYFRLSGEQYCHYQVD